MKFYVINRDGTSIACEFTYKQAWKEMLTWAKSHTEARSLGYTIELVRIDMTARSAIRRLLGNMGGYAASTTQIWPKLPNSTHLS